MSRSCLLFSDKNRNSKRANNTRLSLKNYIIWNIMIKIIRTVRTYNTPTTLQPLNPMWESDLYTANYVNQLLFMVVSTWNLVLFAIEVENAHCYYPCVLLCATRQTLGPFQTEWTTYFIFPKHKLSGYRLVDLFSVCTITLWHWKPYLLKHSQST